MAEKPTSQYIGPIKTYSREHNGKKETREVTSRRGKWLRIGPEIFIDESSFPDHQRLAYTTRLEEGKTLEEVIKEMKVQGQTQDIDGGEFYLMNRSEPQSIAEHSIEVTGYSRWLEHTMSIPQDETTRQKSLEVWQQLSEGFTVTGGQTRRSPFS